MPSNDGNHCSQAFKRSCDVGIRLGGYLAVSSAVLGEAAWVGASTIPVNFVAHTNKRNIRTTDALDVSRPVGGVLQGGAGRDIKHDDCTVSVDVVTVTKTTKLFLTRRIPDVKLDGSATCWNRHSVNLDTERRDVLFPEIFTKETMQEGCFPHCTVPN